MPSIFADIKKEQQQGGQSIFQQPDTMGKSIFQDITPTETKQQPTQDLSKLPESPILQGAKGMIQQMPFWRRGASLMSGQSLEEIDKILQAFPQAKQLPGKLGTGVGTLLGMYPSFRIGGLGGGAVAGKTAGLLAKYIPRAIAKLISTSAGGATTFTGARVLRNIGQNKPIQQGLPQEAGMGAMFGPTGLIRNPVGAVATSATLGAVIAPKGEKLSNAILFGGLTALTHQRPGLSVQDKTNINTLYREATFKEGIREVQRNVSQRQLPAPETIYGEGFTAKPSISRIPISLQKQLGFRQPEQLGYNPNLEQGAIRQGEGFTVTGGKQVARALAKGKAQELRTTPLPKEIIAKVQPQVQQDVVEATKKNLIKPKVEEVKPVQPTGEGKVETLITEIETLRQQIKPLEGKKKLSLSEYSQYKKLSNEIGRKSAELSKIGLSQPTGEGIDTTKPILKTAIANTKGFAEPVVLEFTNSVPALTKETISQWVKEQYPDSQVYITKMAHQIHKTMQGFNIQFVNPETGAHISPPNDFLSKLGLEETLFRGKEPKLSAPTGEGKAGNRGSVAIPPELTEPIAQTATKIYRGVAPVGEVLRNDKLINSVMTERQRKIAELQSGELPQSMVAQRLKEINNSEKVIQAINQSGGKDESIIVTRAADAIDKERAFVSKYTQILDLADKIGITEGSKASETIFKALDYRRASPQEIAKLTPDQQKFIPIIRNAYKDIWKATGKQEYEGIRDYATHLIQTGKEMGYDVSPMGRFLPDEIYSRFFETRKGSKPYQQDVIKALDVYIPSVARKIFREPVLQEYNTILDPHLNLEYKNEAVDFMEAFLGRGRYKGEEVLGNLPKGLVRLTYRGTLYGNFSAATKNATQVLTNTIPEIGGKSVMYGYRRLMSKEGRQEFENSGLSGDFSLGKPIDQLDFFSQVEYINRGVSYLGAKQKALSEGKGLIEAERYAAKIVRKTQFIQTGIDTPKLYRQYGSVGRILGQFTQFPTKQGFLIYNWARQGQWSKVARFATIAYLLGGTQTVPFLDGIIDGDYKQLPQMPEDVKKLVKNVAHYTSLAGLSGMDIGQNFGFGIYRSGVPFARGPAASLIPEIARFGADVSSHRINDWQSIIRSRLIQKSLPTLIPGGTTMKKVIDLINADENNYQIRNTYNQLSRSPSSPKEEILKLLVGSTKQQEESWSSLSKERKQEEIYRNDHNKMLDYILDSKGDTMALEEFMKQYPNYDFGNIVDELTARAKKREMTPEMRNYLARPKALR